MKGNPADDLVKSIIKAGKNLPDQVFKRDFNQYLFFDASLRATEGIPTAIKNIVAQVVESPMCANVFTSITNDFLIFLDEEDCWEQAWKALDNKLLDSLMFESFAVLNPKGDWAVFQYYPVDIGVVGLGKSNSSLVLENNAVDFFSCGEISRWLESSAYEDVNKVEYYGREFLKNLLKSYS